MESITPLTASHVFAYGSLVEPRCLDEVLGHKHLGERLSARLSGFRRVVTADYPYPFIQAASGEWVDGVLLMDLSPYDLQVLDRYEDVASGVYRRERVEVEAWGCGARPIVVRAEVYVAGPVLQTSSTTNQPKRNG
jgi:gamma-glutamylcyclotransferase (GGCT)/AIG2-like uncharacterized protein YtfP